jgi:signal transduction histidine kinase
VRDGQVTLGAVYLSENDYEQAELIVSIQGRLGTISIIACAVVFTLTVIFSRALTLRITQLVEAIRVVSRGNYEHRLDVTGNDELTELGHEFNRLTERLENTEAQRRRFVSDASHELKTPLASIRLLSDSIVQNEEMDAATMREFVTDIGSEADRLQRTTDKLLNLSRLDDAIDLDRVPVDASEVAKATLRLLRPLADARGVSTELVADPGCTVFASEEELYQIIFNLAENAVKYNVEGGSVQLMIARSGSMVVMTVCDSGIGIPEEDRPHVFSRFYRVDKARSREAGGSGLGLSIVYDCVKSLGGFIEIASAEPQGTCITVRLPFFVGGEDGP